MTIHVLLDHRGREVNTSHDACLRLVYRVAHVDLEDRHLRLQEIKHDTQLLNGFTRAIETEIWEVSAQFVANEEDASRIAEVLTT
jgi:hypothetical protein